MLGMIETVYREWLANPLSETARAIYADCLDDYGYEVQANLIRSAWTPTLRISWEGWLRVDASQYWHPDQRVVGGSQRPYKFDPATGPLFTPIVDLELETVPVFSNQYSPHGRRFEVWLDGRDGSVNVTFEEVMNVVRSGVRPGSRMLRPGSRMLPGLASVKLFAIHWPGINPIICESAYTLDANRGHPWMPHWFPRLLSQPTE